jgi:mono/diheme cytochrome c family protein
MRVRLLPVTAMLLVGILSTAASAQDLPRGANIQAGHELASRNCASCHVVEAHQAVPPMPNYGPSFFDIAEKPGTSVQSLRTVLSAHEPMRKMPHAGLTPAQIADVSAYILSLHR